MADPRVGRAGQSSFSPRLGARDPRLRSNQAGSVNDADLDQRTIARDGAGRTRISALDQMKPLPAGTTIAELIAAHNMMLSKLQGR